MICSRSQCENHISRRFYTAISPDKSSEFFSFLSAFVDGSKLRSTNSCLHSCRTHRSWTYSYFHTIRSSFNQRFGRFSSDNIPSDNRSFITKLLSEFFHGINHGFLISMRCINHESSYTELIQRRNFFVKRIYSDGNCHIKLSMSIQSRLINTISDRIFFGKDSFQDSLSINNR